MDGAHRGEVNPAPAAGACLFPGLRERECVGVLPVKRLMREGGAGERKREGRCQMQGGRAEGGRHNTRARIQGRLCVQAECVKPNNACVVPAKMTLSVNKYSNLNNRAETCQEGDITPYCFHSSCIYVRVSEFVIKETI